MLYLVTCEEKGLDKIVERFCRDNKEIIPFLEEQGYSASVIQQAVEEKGYESTFDLITIRCLRRKNVGGRSRSGVLAIQASILAAVVANYPKPTTLEQLHEESPSEISDRTLARYISDWEATDMLERIKGGVQLTKVGVQSYIAQAQKSSLHMPA